MKRSMTMLATGAALAGTLAACGGETPMPHPTSLTLDQERETYANRYTSCKITNVADKHTVGKDEYGEERSKVQVGVNLSLTDVARKVREKYSDDDTVWATYPHGLGVTALGGESPLEAIKNHHFVKRDSLERDSSPLPEFTNDSDGPQSFTLYPKTEHLVGEHIDVYVESEGKTNDEHAITATTTWTDCGSIVLKAVADGDAKGHFEWVVDPSAKIDAPLVETASSPLHN